MPRKTVQDVTIASFPVSSWGGGINTNVPPTEIGDDQSVDILNFEFDQNNNLRTRPGTENFLGLFPAQTFPNITSLHYSENDAGQIHVLFTTKSGGAGVLYAANNIGTSLTNITGALTLPENNIWYWRNFDGKAIGVNGATSGTNPVKCTGATPTAAALAGSPPRGKYIEIWNNRVWMVDAANPNTLRASALGNAEDWTTAGAAGTITIDISKNDGDRITGMIAFRERLFVFKRTKIYVVSADATPETDPANLRVDLYSPNLGCVSQRTIQVVLNDILFLTESGVASLVSSQVVGNFNAAFLSRDIRQLSNYLKSDIEGIYAQVVDTANQYWLCLPAASNPLGINEVFVLDYRDIQNGRVRWVRFTGKVAGTAMCSIFVSGEKRYVIGSNSDTSVYRLFVYVPGDDETFDDNGFSYAKRLLTKRFNLSLPFIRKLFHYFYFKLTLTSDQVNLIVSHIFDGDSAKQVAYRFIATAASSGGLWDTALWDTSLWYSEELVEFHARERIKQSTFGRKAIDIQFTFSNSQAQGFTLEDFAIDYGVLNERHVRNIESI